MISFLVLACLTAVPASVAQERPTVLEVGLLIDGADISAESNFIGKKREALQDFVRGLEESFRLARGRPDLVRRTYEKHLKISSSLTLDWMVKDYMSAKVLARPAPNPRVIEAYLEELGLGNRMCQRM